jgi:hypothetical protein
MVNEIASEEVRGERAGSGETIQGIVPAVLWFAA